MSFGEDRVSGSLNVMAAPHSSGVGDIVHLNVGGTRFSTSRQTLTWIPDSFFTALLSDRITSHRDEIGALFIDRDPKLFSVILNYLRTKDIDLRNIDIRMLRHEAEYYGITPLVKRLMLCEDLTRSSCGDVLFYGYLPPPSAPLPEPKKPSTSENEESATSGTVGHTTTAASKADAPSTSQTAAAQSTSQNTCGQSHKEGLGTHVRNCSLDYKVQHRGSPHSRNPSLDLKHIRNNSADSNKTYKNDVGSAFGSQQASSWVDPLRVQIIKAHHNCIVIAYAHFIMCYQLTTASTWQHTFTSPYIDAIIERVAITAKLTASVEDRMVAVSYGSTIRLWNLTAFVECIGTFNLIVRVEYLFFIGSQLVALSPTNKIGVWHAMTHHWQMQDVVPMLSFDTAGSFLVLGCNNGAIYYIDMEKFPLRMKDNDLLVTQLYRDPNHDPITAISVYLTPKTTQGSYWSWIEIAYGTKSGSVKVVVQHPETVGHGPQLFQTFTVHQSSVTKVTLSEKYLVSVCSEYNHVRSWAVTRFRGMISTQPGSTPKASFRIVSLEALESCTSYNVGNDFGPFGEQDDEQVFIQKVVPETDQLFVRLASNGKRVCVIKSVDGSVISSFYVHEREGSSRMGSRPSRFIFTGHSNGTLQMWDLSTALKPSFGSTQGLSGGPTPEELWKLLDQYDLSNSHSSTPCISPCPSVISTGPSLKTSNALFLNQENSEAMPGSSQM